jgi:putative ABC transport system permease protein
VGLVKGFAPPAQAYVPKSELGRTLGEFQQANRVAITFTPDARRSEAAQYDALLQRFGRANMRVGATALQDQLRKTIEAGWDAIVGVLLIMAILLGIGGGLGLMATMSINVIERTREIGVMRAIGASDSSIRGLVVGEGLVVATAGWLIAAPFSPLAGLALSDAFGQAFLHVPLVYRFSWAGLGVWLGLVLAVAALSSLLPAWNASRLTVREVLAYA